MLNQTELERLQQQLRPFSTAASQLSAEEQKWRQYYGLVLPGTAHLGRLEVGQFQVATQLLLPENTPKATLIVLHGYYDHMGLYGHIYRWALAKDFAVLSCDLPGHGLSTGPRASIDDFSDYTAVLLSLLEQAQQLQLPAPIHLLGQSTGGAIITDYLLRRRPKHLPLGEIILLAPLVRPWAWAQGQALYHLLKPFVASIKRAPSDNSTDAAFLEFIKHDPLQATTLPVAWVTAMRNWIALIHKAKKAGFRPIVVQGQQDKTVDWRYNLSFLSKKFTSLRVLYLPEARHHLVNEAVDLRQQMLSFIDECLSVSALAHNLLLDQLPPQSTTPTEAVS
ncbi:alpha/beta hydrolase [Thiopseudomonas alkaliphila]|uniref:Alpha/beta hydrolase n=1 Tax=Thiopseudomonas alkaliphila TaxID=1697053 RepID=A0AAW7DUC3_9GAMM|nr:alpha/beta hydrolase [Thiopseudomonas alkaliphila]MDM1696955.1 alpha/beta hydrolase [Thiopseudomonas alkaliphila]MDM1716672.1 alpha/beta hydrolase [Thiopseudomonas alkaliphila]